ncbi:flavin-containing monooxygenase 5-like [Dermacentor albipictus]|uniref:flavin-containing monooxygenase 5-like n=1 Tax=Dermacentor albipictus TaxID=60249 RepID=UPI0038FCA6C1
MRVAVVGAGCCGITAVKACLEEGLDVVCFEKASDCGGLWWYRDETPESGTGTVMRFTVANTSKEMSCYSDFPPDKDAPVFMPHWQTLRYIRSYADHFGVTPKIRFNHDVLRLDRDGTLRIRDSKTGREWEDVFDGVLVCTGHHGSPSVPDIPGRELFRGRVMHSREYKYADDSFRDKTVVVVGFANSALDVAVNLSSVARQVFVSTRRINWVLPCHYKSIPIDAYLYNQTRLWLFSWLPLSWYGRFVARVVNDAWDHKALGVQPSHDTLSQALVINQYIDGKILDGTVKIRGPPQRFTENGLVMNYVEEDVDAVVFATGFTTGLPFQTDALSRDGERLLLYKMMIPPANPNVAFLGFVDGNANLLQAFEMQARYMARVFSGKVKLPSREAMEADVAATQQKMKSFYVPTSRHSLMIDKIAYVEELAKIIGVKPNYFKLLLTDPKVYYALVTSPVLNYQYRLEGPHSWKGARDAILGFQDRMRAPLRRRNGENGRPSSAKNCITVGKLSTLLVAVGVSVYLISGSLRSAQQNASLACEMAAKHLPLFAATPLLYIANRVAPT